MKTKKSILTVLCALCLCLPCLLLTACGHEHTFSQEWSTSSTEHWHACTGEDCDEVESKGAHIASDWKVDTAATCGTAGSRHKECKVCKYVMETETIPATGRHTYVDGICSVCGNIEASKTALVETNGTKKAYDSFVTAVNEAPEGSTVTLLKNLELADGITLNKNITIDFGGYELYLNQTDPTGSKGLRVGTDTKKISVLLKNGTYRNSSWLIALQKQAILTIAQDMNLVLDSTSPFGIGVIDGTTLNFYGKLSCKDGSNAYGVTTYIGDDAINATINIYAGAEIHSSLDAVVATSGTTVNVYGTLISDKESALSGNGTAGEGNITLNIFEGALVESKTETGIYMPNSGALNIMGGTIKGSTAVYIKSGNVTISGGKLEATKETYADYKYYGNGCNSTGDAIVIDACGYPGGNPTVSISGGEIVVADTANAHKIGYYKYNGNEATLTIAPAYTNDLFTKVVNA